MSYPVTITPVVRPADPSRDNYLIEDADGDQWQVRTWRDAQRFCRYHGCLPVTGPQMREIKRAKAGAR